MTRKQAVIISLLVIVAIALGFMVSRRFWFRLDLTKNRAYTISSVSRNLHTEIPNQIRITYYVSDKLRAIHPMPGEIEDLLREYAAYSRGKIQVIVKDPLKAGVVEDIERMGLQAQQIQTMDMDQTGLITVYTGIVIDYLDNIEVLPVVFSLSTLEYDLTTRIRSLVSGIARQAGIIVGDNPRNYNEDYRFMHGMLAQSGYRLRLITPETDIPDPDTLPLLIVLGGVEAFNDTALYRIDRYIQMGGRVFFTVKAVTVDKEGSIEARALDDSGLLDMLSAYGVTILPEIVMDRSALTMQYQTRSPNGAIQLRIARNPQWIRILPENGNREHPIGAGFMGIDMYWATPIVLNAHGSLEAVPLFTTTGEAWTMSEPFYTNPDISYLFERDAAVTQGAKILGVSLSGVFPSWFRDKPKPSVYYEDGELPDMPETAKPARVIVISDTEFITSFLNVSGATRNLDFLLQALDWLGNDDDIIGIRNRESVSANLDKIIDRDKKAAAIRFAQLVNIIIMPLLTVLAGVFIAVRRRAKSRIISGQDENSAEMIKEKSDEI
jgi:gliding-associated putative ABC transporter substrate-binding component GldG